MINVVRSEWIKVRTVAMHWVLALIAIAFPLVITILTALFNGDSADFDTRSLLEVLGGTSVVAVLLLGVLAAATVTSDFGFNTIRPTFAATPRRLRVMGAKVFVMVTYALVSQAIVMFLGRWHRSSLSQKRWRRAPPPLGTLSARLAPFSERR